MGVEAGEIGLIRHSRTQWNVENRVQGLTDNTTTPEGLEDTRQYALQLLSLGFGFDRVYSSALQRSIETAEVFQDVLGIKSHFIEPDFNERGQGDLEGLAFEQAEILELDPEVNSGEDRHAFKKRVIEAYARIKKREIGKSILLVIHSANIKAIFEVENFNPEGRRIPHDTLFYVSSRGEISTIQ